MKNYKINEIFYSFQGEGHNTGKSAIFIRFSGCNVWSGQEKDRIANSSCGKWCDTDFKSFVPYDADEIIDSLLEINYAKKTPQLIVFTGGEPLLKLDEYLIQRIQKIFPTSLCCIETNGTIDKSFDESVFITCSPKENTNLKLKKCTEMKIVLPQNLDIQKILNNCQYSYLYFQPKNNLENLEYIIPYLQEYLGTKLSLQVHKLIGAR